MRSRTALTALLCLTLLFVSGCKPRPEAPVVQGGFIDLSSWNFEAHGPVPLAGDWEFHWNGDQKTDYFPLPRLWKGKTANGVELSPHGIGTYRLRLRMPDTDTGRMGVLAAGGLSVCEVVVNGKTVAATGEVGSDAESEHPERHYVIAESPDSGPISEISLTVSNHRNVQGGINGTVLLGTAQQIHGVYSHQRMVTAGLAGAMLCLAILYITLYLLRGAGRENLYFGLFCLFWCVGLLFNPTAGFLMADLVPSLPWEWYVNLAVLPYGMTIPLMLMFYLHIFPKPYGGVLVKACWMAGLLYMGYILLTPPNAYDPVLFIYAMLGKVALLYMCACFAVDLYHRKKGVWVLSFGYLALALAEFDDQLIDMHVVGASLVQPVCIFIFILAYAFYLALRFTHAFNRSEELSGELEANNVRLVRMDELKDEFLANTTHEMKTPLVGMVGIAESLLAAAGERLSDEDASHLRVIVHSGNRLSKLIDDVLDLSRLRHEDVALRFGPVNPGAVARRVLALARAVQANDRVELVNRVPDDCTPVRADADRLEQILLNLVGNSIKFTDSGSITVSAEPVDGKVKISVADTGRGIFATDQKRIFDAYEQGDPHEPGGVGLGLSIARQLVELHGGKLELDSEPGAGSTFSFLLPVSDEEAPAEKPEAPVSGLQLGEAVEPDGHYQVLVVDDEPVNLHVVASIFKIAGITFRTTENGAEALRMVETDNPDMVLLDVMMPDMSGYDVCRELRRTHPASSLPVVMLTVKNRDEDIVEGFAAGANDYLCKPFSRDELGARVTTQLKLKEAYGALAENLELRRELELRAKTESRLRFLRARLAKILDSLGHAIVGVNRSREIAFCNQPFAELAGADADALIGRPLESLLDRQENGADQLLKFLDSGTPDGETLSLENVRIGDAPVSLQAGSIEFEEESLTLLAIRPAGTGESPGLAVPTELLQDLEANRQRVLDLEEAMSTLESGSDDDKKRVREDIKALDGLLSRIGSNLLSGPGTQDRRALAANVMNLAVECWTAGTRTTKAEMAERSGLWNVYMERDGYSRTQTLDKYLDKESMPGKPRWNHVLATAKFVLANCPEDAPNRLELERAHEELRAALQD
jgi:two-component system sensor histidine kinase ChiS